MPISKTTLAPTVSAGACTGEIVRFGSGAPVRRVELDWTSSAGGVVTAAFASEIEGLIFQAITVPHATAPTDNYDITITDEDGNDIMDGALANRDTANTEYAHPLTDVTFPDPFVQVRAYGTLTLNVSNAGATKQGKIVLMMTN